MFNKNLFNCIKLSTNDLNDNSIINDPTTNPKMISNTQQWSISLRNKLKKKFNSSLKRIHRKRLDKSASKDSGFNLSANTTNTNCSSSSGNKSSFDSNLLSSTKYNSTTIDYLLHEGFFSDYSDCEEEDEEYEDSESDESFSSLSSLSSIGSLESISASRTTLQEKNNKSEFKYAKQTRFHPLISSSKVSLNNVNNMRNFNDSISSDIALQRKLTPFKTSSRKSLLLSEQDRGEEEAKFKLTDNDIDDAESINLSRITTVTRTNANGLSNVLNKCYSFYFSSFDLTHSNQTLDDYNAVCSSTLCKGKRITFNEFIRNEIYSNYFL